MKYWWVNQKQTFKQESEGGYMWSPKTSTNGGRIQYYENMRLVTPGDLVFSYRNQQIAAIGVIQCEGYTAPKPSDFGKAGDVWPEDGWRVDVEYKILKNQIYPKRHMDILGILLPEKYSPLQPNGDGNQVYLCSISNKMGEALLGLIGEEPPQLGQSFKAERIPEGITRNHILRAIMRIDSGVPNKFSDSTGYDVFYDGKRYPPKALIGVAAEELTGAEFGPYDFKGGLKSKCFRVLESNGFEIITKGDVSPFPEESADPAHFEGAINTVTVNRYERDSDARKKCIKHYGAKCQVCELDFSITYGSIGDGFIHVHHLVPIATIGKEYEINPVADLIPVCPNCHAMLHKKNPPFLIKELQDIIRRKD